MYKVYILESLQNSKKRYIGHTQDLVNRIKRHNKGLVRSTKAYIPWKTIHTEIFDTKNEAYKRELQIKSYKSGEAFKKLINKGG
ncbi:MAG: GIY-YIG nuclease family protein [Parcubacteria group bacterium]|jgi:putative endonuclease